MRAVLQPISEKGGLGLGGSQRHKEQSLWSFENVFLMSSETGLSFSSELSQRL